MQNENVRHLIGQYMNDELTPEQQAALLQLLDQHNENELVEVLREMMESETANAAAVDAGIMQASLQKVLAADKAGGEIAPAPVVPMKRRWYWAAAAVAILAVGITGYMLFNKKATPPVSVATSTNTSDVQPGGNKAILTLANGQQIVLDSAANGMLSQEGNARVMKDGSTLEYQSPNDDRQSTIAYNTLATPKGGQYKLVLPDGSKVWLNAASSIKYPTVFGDKERSVEITGEAYFEIAPLTHNGGENKIPFIVNLPPIQGGARGSIEVLGTHFNVNAYSDEASIKTTLLEGKVKVKSEERAVVLNPGEQASMKDNATYVVKGVDTEETVAWTKEMFIFRDQRIEDIMKQISRWYDVEIHYAGKPVQEGFNGAIPRNVPVSKVLRLLELTTLVHFKIEGKKVTVLP